MFTCTHTDIHITNTYTNTHTKITKIHPHIHKQLDIYTNT